MEKGLTVSLPGPASPTTRLPLIIEISLTVSQIFVLIVACTTAILSIIARADILTIFIRTAAAILFVGMPVFLLNWLLGRYFVEATISDWQDSISKKEAAVALEKQSKELETEA
jgi:hypothetical protein